MELDRSVKDSLLDYISSLADKKIKSLYELQDGKVFFELLLLLDHFTRNESNFIPGSKQEQENHWLIVRKFIEDYYSCRSDEDSVLDFELAQSAAHGWELELAKIAVAIFSIGVLDRNREMFTTKALSLPDTAQTHLLHILQAVVPASSDQQKLTPAIHDVLCADSRDSTPSRESTPSNKDQSFSTPKHRDTVTPARDGPLVLNTMDTLTPIRHGQFGVNTPLSPLASFVHSPQLVQKAVLRQKEEELRRVKAELSSEMLQREEAELALGDQKKLSAQKDAEIKALKTKVSDLLQCQEAKEEIKDLEARLEKLRQDLEQSQKDCRKYGEHVRLLEEENKDLFEKNDMLQQQVESLKKGKSSELSQVQELCSLLHTGRETWENQAKAMQECLQWQRDERELRDLLDAAKERNKELQDEIEALQAMQVNQPCSETMGEVLDLQIREVKDELERVTYERDRLCKQFESSQQKLFETEERNHNLESEKIYIKSHVSELETLLQKSMEQSRVEAEAVQGRFDDFMENVAGKLQNVYSLIFDLDPSQGMSGHSLKAFDKMERNDANKTFGILADFLRQLSFYLLGNHVFRAGVGPETDVDKIDSQKLVVDSLAKIIYHIETNSLETECECLLEIIENRNRSYQDFGSDSRSGQRESLHEAMLLRRESGIHKKEDSHARKCRSRGQIKNAILQRLESKIRENDKCLKQEIQKLETANAELEDALEKEQQMCQRLDTALASTVAQYRTCKTQLLALEKEKEQNPKLKTGSKEATKLSYSTVQRKEKKTTLEIPEKYHGLEVEMWNDRQRVSSHSSKKSLQKERRANSSYSDSESDKSEPSSPLQADSPGTIIYFPLDKNGPVYPPPRVPLRRRSTNIPGLTSLPSYKSEGYR